MDKKRTAVSLPKVSISIRVGARTCRSRCGPKHVSYQNYRFLTEGLRYSSSATALSASTTSRSDSGLPTTCARRTIPASPSLVISKVAVKPTMQCARPVHCKFATSSRFCYRHAVLKLVGTVPACVCVFPLCFRSCCSGPGQEYTKNLPPSISSKLPSVILISNKRGN